MGRGNIAPFGHVEQRIFQHANRLDGGAKVRSGCSATRANSHSTCSSNGDVLPPLSFALVLPLSRQRCNHHLTAELALRLKLSAASRRDAPATTASITRSRKSSE